MELARRGIPSSICSKNDAATVEPILRQEGIWDYFIFPSIDWTPKGQRVAEIVADAQLRPATVLFIDDNPVNRAEAERSCPGIQVSDERIIPTLLADARLQGKDDRELTRLQQYKVLEAKKDATASVGANTAFLQSSGVRVFIEHAVENWLDRAVELINRTNQLNFTKSRLPEDAGEAKVVLRTQLDSYVVNAGIVFAADNSFAWSAAVSLASIATRSSSAEFA